jgi:amino acid transporter
MKKILLSFFAGITVTFALANTTPVQNVFNDDLARMEQNFSDLTAVEQVVTNQSLTYAELVAANSALTTSLKAENDLGTSLLGANAPDERLLDIPGFWWGFCAGLIGVVLMYVAIEDPVAKQREGKQALIGCLVANVSCVLLYALYVVFVGLLVTASGG